MCQVSSSCRSSPAPNLHHAARPWWASGLPAPALLRRKRAKSLRLPVRVSRRWTLRGQSHSRGRRFDPDQLHKKNTKAPVFRVFLLSLCTPGWKPSSWSLTPDEPEGLARLRLSLRRCGSLATWSHPRLSYRTGTSTGDPGVSSCCLRDPLRLGSPAGFLLLLSEASTLLDGHHCIGTGLAESLRWKPWKGG
jgi:hypothetical protein